jgi:hypothetical protein
MKRVNVFFSSLVLSIYYKRKLIISFSYHSFDQNSFDICKVIQRQYQTVENRDVVDERSIVEADFYAKRFKEFIFERVFHPADDELATHPISMNVFSHTSNQQESAQYEKLDPNQAVQSNTYPEVHHL